MVGIQSRKSIRGVGLKLLCVAIFLAFVNISSAQLPKEWKVLGDLKTLHASQIKTSRWSIGGETLDRNYADYNAYKSYLGPLGAKRIRLQGGWAKSEKVKGQYDFAWLDSIVNDAIAQGVKPWLQTSYGNPIYQGGGEAALAGGIPVSAEALAAWDKWVEAFVNHFKDRVNEWEIWNEPDLSKKFTAQDYATFYERTADVIRSAQPDSRLIGLALCCMDWPSYADTFVSHLQSVNKTNLIDIVSFHGYMYRPEDTYKRVAELRKVILKANPRAEFWQGENGAPSVKKGETVGAMSEYDWSELTQAKWNLRRTLGDMGHDIDVTNLFQMSDMYYANTDHMKGYNSKGILKTRPDLSIERPKQTYYAFQHVNTLFSGNIQREKVEIKKSENLEAFVYKKNSDKGNILNLWMARIAPVEDDSENNSITISVEDFDIKKPVYIDLITGKVYELDTSSYKNTGKNKYTFSNIPVPDFPVVITDRSLIDIK